MGLYSDGILKKGILVRCRPAAPFPLQDHTNILIQEGDCRAAYGNSPVMCFLLLARALSILAPAHSLPCISGSPNVVLTLTMNPSDIAMWPHLNE